MSTNFHVIAVLFCAGVVATRAQTVTPLELKQTIALPGVEGRIDHLAFDSAGERLFVCALGNNTVEVIDLAKGARVHSITGLGAPQGIAYVPKAGRIYVANDKGGVCRIYDARSYQLVGEIDFKDDADNVRYDEASKRVYVGFGSGGIGIVSAPDGKTIGSIKLAAHPEAFELEKHGPRIFVNVPNARQVTVVDREKSEIIANWKTNGALGNFPMALDEANQRLFIGCRDPAKLVVLDTTSGKTITSIEISGDPDEIFFDDERHRLYAVCGTGKIDVIEQADANSYKTVTRIDTAAGARTGFFALDRDILFVAVPHHGSQAAEVRCYRVK